jgi:hypothetical protein
MNEIDDDITFEQELSRHLACRLDPQCGRAARAVEEHVRSHSGTTHTWLRVAAVFVIVSAGVAAFVWIAQTFLLRHPPQLANTPLVVPVHPFAPATATTDFTPRDLTQLTAWTASDEGVEIVTLADQQMPVRKVRRDAVETTQWFDPQSNAQIKLIVPVQQEILIEEDTY